MKAVAVRNRFPARRLVLGAVALYAALACAIDRAATPVQEWYEGFGPVIPHDTFPADCTLCHAGEDWSTIRDDFAFDHLAQTGYALEGAHAAAQCLRCHNDRGPVQLYAQRGCAGCHEDVHRGLQGAGCGACHDQRSWRPNEQVTQHTEYGFPLVGAHAAAACWRCHPNAQVGNFTRTTALCADCHRDDLARATDPDHAANGWIADCDDCHIPTTWGGAAFKHPWPLTGAHRALDCEACHVGGVFTGTPDQCVDCHLDDYQSASDPDHVALNISTECQQCHNTSTWEGASFNHSGITTDCVTCHLDDYQATTNPNHANAGFPTSCEDCHTTKRWVPANFDHDFPIGSGDHGGLDCAECHQQPGNYQFFSCTHCHEHNQQDMAEEHDEVPDYVWSSPACYDCHPKGQADDD
jgi:hypothetical protein